MHLCPHSCALCPTFTCMSSLLTAIMCSVKPDGAPQLCRTDEIGELCVCGAATGTSYYGLSGMTKNTFEVGWGGSSSRPPVLPSGGCCQGHIHGRVDGGFSIRHLHSTVLTFPIIFLQFLVSLAYWHCLHLVQCCVKGPFCIAVLTLPASGETSWWEDRCRTLRTCVQGVGPLPYSLSAKVKLGQV